MKKHTQLSRAERCEIMILRNKGYSMATIGKALGRSRNTINYEIKENSTNGIYDAKKAHAKARVRKKAVKFQWKKINQDEALRNYIIEKLMLGWNPDEISGRMKVEKQPFYVSKTAIYEWLRSSRGDQYCKYLSSQRYYVKRRKKKTDRVMIPYRTSITKRSVAVDNRSRATDTGKKIRWYLGRKVLEHLQ